MKFHWFLPTASDGRSLTVGTRGTHGPGHDAQTATDPGADRFRTPDIHYLTQIAQAAEHMGFDAVLTPTGTWCEDAWLTCAARAQETERLRFLVAFRPGFISPTLAAQMAATFQRISRGRLLLNVVTGGEADEQARFGDHLTKAGRYERCSEFLTVLRGTWSGEPFTHTGTHYDVRGATVMAPPNPIPQLYFSGSSTEAGPVAVRHADTYLTWGEPPEQVAKKLDWIHGLAAKQRRTLRFGIRFHVHRARAHDPAVVVSVLSQRRYHPAFQRMRELIAEVAADTNCPVTSIQSFHGDGQWRLPDELVDLTYHGYQHGYGKAAHSGYHLFDIVPWLIAAGERPGKELNEVEVHTHITRPTDSLAQLTVADHEQVFPGFAARNPYSHAELQQLTETFGEVDAFSSMAFLSHGRTITLGSINLAHHTFSQRGNLTPAHAHLYKGNGRVGQETHIIHQGPFQALYFHCLQTLHEDTPGVDPTAIGGADHVNVHVFRNHHVRPRWDRHTTLGFADLTSGVGPDATLPTQRSSRNRAITEFLLYLAGQLPRQRMVSDLTAHRRPARLMAATYLSMAQRLTGGSPTATLDFRAAPASPQQPLAQLETAP